MALVVDFLELELSLRWQADIQPFGPSPHRAAETFADLAGRYQAPDRHYHNLEHIKSVLARLDWDRTPSLQAGLVFAAWLHDVIYDSRAKDNEARSAEYAREVLMSLNVPADIRQETGRLILLTHTHEAAPDDTRGHLLLDADLAVLAASEAEYDAYAAAIRREYAWVSDADYRAGRRRVLEGFLARSRIYLTNVMYTTGEARARANLTREIAALRGA